MTGAEALASVLRGRGVTVSLAESCTGGMVGAEITAIPGASEYFLGSAVTYSDGAKEAVLGVPRGILATYGAVSPQAAALMARGSRMVYGSDIAVSVTGTAGPAGTGDGPAGLVYTAASDSLGTTVEKHFFAGGRDLVRRQAADAALSLLAHRAEELLRSMNQ